MTDDVMARLMSVEALPRGERLARWHKCVFYAVDLLEGSRVLDAVWRCTGGMTAENKADCWRQYAAPLRKAREELRKLRDEIMFVEDVALKFQGENEELLLENARLLKQFMQVKKDSP